MRLPCPSFTRDRPFAGIDGVMELMVIFSGLISLWFCMSDHGVQPMSPLCLGVFIFSCWLWAIIRVIMFYAAPSKALGAEVTRVVLHIHFPRLLLSSFARPLVSPASPLDLARCIRASLTGSGSCCRPRCGTTW